MNNNKVYESILNNIATKCDNDIDKMSYADKMVYKQICEEIKQQIISFVEENWNCIDFWCNYDLSRELELSKSPDLEKIRSLLGGKNTSTINAEETYFRRF